MVKRIRSRRKKKLEPDLPYGRETLDLPRYFNIINTGRTTERPLEPVLPKRRDEIGEAPKAIPMPKPGKMHRGEQMPLGREEPQKTPLLVRGLRYVKSLVMDVEPALPERRDEIGGTPKAIPRPKPGTVPRGEEMPQGREDARKMPLLLRGLRYLKSLIMEVEPERPVRMPKVPELNFPPLYTRYPVMTTVSKVTDGDGKIIVDFPHNFVNVPGVVMTVKGVDTLVGNVTDVTLGTFTAVFFTIEHNHGGTVIENGKHTPEINADGDHTHEVTGVITWDEDSQYGYLTASDWSDYETDHVHTQVQTQLESAHVHGLYDIQSAGAHTHSIPATDGPDDTDYALIDANWGIWCDACNEWLIDRFDTGEFALGSHWHLNTGKRTGSDGAHTHPRYEYTKATSHRHLLNDTGAQPSPGHRHQIAYPSQYDHYITDITIDAFLTASAKESPYHYHTAPEVVDHDHVVIPDGANLWTNESVTITYLAQEETL
ncbi:MAG: hypothetical protein U9N01_04590 [Euryarchaeota archaeon]|nr:hypothetical protein [Euryarchaeota archaeon]